MTHESPIIVHELISETDTCGRDRNVARSMTDAASDPAPFNQSAAPVISPTPSPA